MSLPRRFIPYLAKETLEAFDTHGALPRKLLKTYAAFANTQGGLIVIGARLRPGGELVPSGLADSLSTIRHLWALLNDPAQVSVNILANADIRIEKIGGRDVIAVRVPCASREDRPVHLGRRALGHAYRRVGNETQACPEEDVRAMERDARPAPDARPLTGAPLSSMALATIGAYHDELRRVRPAHPWLALDTPEEFLMRLGAIRRSPQTHLLHPTLAGLLMFGIEKSIVRELPFYSLSYHEETGATRYTLVSDDGAWSGNVFDFWLSVAKRLVSLPVQGEYGVDCADVPVDEGKPPAGAKREGEAGESPAACGKTGPFGRAALEAVANALAHADYRARGGVRVARENGGLCIENAGLPGGEAAMALVEGGLAWRRNPTLKSMFELVGIGREAGGGIATMRDACEASEPASPRSRMRLSLAEEYDPARTVLTLEPIAPDAANGPQGIPDDHPALPARDAA